MTSRSRARSSVMACALLPAVTTIFKGTLRTRLCAGSTSTSSGRDVGTGAGVAPMSRPSVGVTSSGDIAAESRGTLGVPGDFFGVTAGLTAMASEKGAANGVRDRR